MTLHLFHKSCLLQFSASSVIIKTGFTGLRFQAIPQHKAMSTFLDDPCSDCWGCFYFFWIPVVLPPILYELLRDSSRCLSTGSSDCPSVSILFCCLFKAKQSLPSNFLSNLFLIKQLFSTHDWMLTKSAMPSVFCSEFCRKLLKIPTELTSFWGQLLFAVVKDQSMCYHPAYATLLGVIISFLSHCTHLKISKSWLEDFFMLVKSYERDCLYFPHNILWPFSYKLAPKKFSKKISWPSR